jgi:hypothetical protein
MTSLGCKRGDHHGEKRQYTVTFLCFIDVYNLLSIDSLSVSSGFTDCIPNGYDPPIFLSFVPGQHPP